MNTPRRKKSHVYSKMKSLGARERAVSPRVLYWVKLITRNKGLR